MRHNPRVLRYSLWSAAVLFVAMETVVYVHARIYSPAPNVIGMAFWAICAIAVALIGVLLSILTAPKRPRS